MQNKIFYIGCMKTWITVNNRNEIEIWELEKEKSKVLQRKSRAKISDIVECPNLQLIAISSFDRKITLWNLNHRRYFCVIDLAKGSANIVKYCNDFKYIIASGFETDITIYKIHISKDYSEQGLLKGHQHVVTAMEVCEE